MRIVTSRSAQSTDDNFPADKIAGLLEQHGNAMRNNQPLSIEGLLLEIQPEYRSALLTDLLVQELELRQPPPARDQAGREFRDRFPDRLSAVSAALDQWQPEPVPLPPVPVPPEPVPVAIGKYKVLRLLGTGSFATVYLAENPGLNREVALKVPLTRPPEHRLDPDLPQQPGNRKRNATNANSTCFANRWISSVRKLSCWPKWITRDSFAFTMSSTVNTKSPSSFRNLSKAKISDNT
jgi:hypothetical protein